MRILVVEDEVALAEALQGLLTKHGFETDVTGTAFSALDAALTNAYDCLVVDVMLPDGNGMQLVRDLRQLKCYTPVLMLTARNELRDRVEGLNAGADDYLGKPFDPEELLARVQALLRRTNFQLESDTLVLDAATLHQKSRTLEVGDHLLELSLKEFTLLEYFFRHPSQVLSRDQLISHVWGPEAEVADNALDTYIYFLRKKCAKIGLRNVIKTVRGQGYRLGSM